MQQKQKLRNQQNAELAKVEAQPDNAETADAAATAQKIVNAAEDKGVADVTAVHPIAKNKQNQLQQMNQLKKKQKSMLVQI